MMRSLYSGVAGLKTHQTKMDVIGNNIANVNTVGFKSSQVLFKDVLYQTTQSATGATGSSGGTNAKQIGLGSGVATVSVTQTNGSAQSTNNPYDLMINGSSFFVVNRAGTNYFTKVGAFKTDDSGNLVTGSGDLVMGWQVDPDNPTEIKRDTVSALRPEAEENQTASPEMTSKMYMHGNIASVDSKLQTTDGVVTTVPIYDNLGYAYTVKFKITQSTTDSSLYNLSIDSIKDSNNVDILQNGYQASLGDATIKFDLDSGKFVGMGGVA
ncbi:MAG: flagellar hook-basal body complex protein, partial [Clostridiales bacterium]|nr:flagellar hook-basal body complex protein [Clostridiales bacterium]